MLQQTLVFAVLASLAATITASAAPVDAPVELKQYIPDSETPENLNSRDGGFSVRCFASPACQGNVIGYVPDNYSLQSGSWASYGVNNAPPTVSCRLDTWGGWAGTIYLSVGNPPFSAPHVSGNNYSPGSGQYCVDIWPSPPGTPNKNINVIVGHY